MALFSENFIIAQKFTCAAEGGLTNDPEDSGGITNHGVSFKFLTGIAKSQAGRDRLAEYGVLLPITDESIINLTKEQAEKLFHWQFWEKLSCDKLPLRMAILVYDAAVNSGPFKGVQLAQRGYNKIYSKDERLVEDGRIGPKTIAALSSHDTTECHGAILKARDDFYEDLIAQKPKLAVFRRGWHNRTRNLAKYLREIA